MLQREGTKNAENDKNFPKYFWSLFYVKKIRFLSLISLGSVLEQKRRRFYVTYLKILFFLGNTEGFSVNREIYAFLKG